MVRYNQMSSLRNLDLDNTQEMRSVMMVLEACVRPPLGPPFKTLTAESV
jgi:hypothetical protein